MRDPNEYGSALAAELHGIPHARVAIGLASTEELGMGIAASAVDAIRRAEGLPPDPDAERLRRAPYLSLFPPTLDDGAQPDTQRFRDPAWDEPPGELPDWWPGREHEPLVYVTFGSVAGSFPQALPVYGLAMRAVAELRARVLLTVGRELDLAALRPPRRTCAWSAGYRSRTCSATPPRRWSTVARARPSARSPPAYRWP